MSYLLLNAVNANDVDEVRRLVTDGADVNIRNRYDYGLLPVAMRRQLEIVKILVEVGGANINSSDGRGCTPLQLAIIYDVTDTMKYLLQKGANRYATNTSGETILMDAVEYERVDIARTLLVDYRMDPNVVSHFGKTALKRAVQLNNREMVNLLLENGANIYDDLIEIAIERKFWDVVMLTLCHGQRNELSKLPQELVSLILKYC